MLKSILALTVFSLTATAQTAAWKTINPAEAGLDSAKFTAWQARLAARKTSGVLVVRRGSIVFEWYSSTSGPGKPHGTASMAKALILPFFFPWRPMFQKPLDASFDCPNE